MTQLSPNFRLSEFTRSQSAVRMGRPIIATPEIIDNLEHLCVYLLEPIRNHFGGRRITITSGYRPDWLNVHIGGSLRSDHVHGRAADFEVEGLQPAEVARELEIVMVRRPLPIKQLILEFPPDGWVHVSIPEIGVQPRRELLTAVSEDGKTVYWPGVHA